VRCVYYHEQHLRHAARLNLTLLWRSPVFSETNSFIATLFLFLLWGNAQIAVSFFLSSIFNSTRFATST
jgi:hypothetical protein